MIVSTYNDLKTINKYIKRLNDNINEHFKVRDYFDLHMVQSMTILKFDTPMNYCDYSLHIHRLKQLLLRIFIFHLKRFI